MPYIQSIERVMDSKGTAKYNMIQYKVERQEDGSYMIQGDQYTIKLFLELMNRYVTEDKFVTHPDDKGFN